MNTHNNFWDGLRNAIIPTILLWLLIGLAVQVIHGQLNISGNPPLPVAYGGTNVATGDNTTTSFLQTTSLPTFQGILLTGASQKSVNSLDTTFTNAGTLNGLLHFTSSNDAADVRGMTFSGAIAFGRHIGIKPNVDTLTFGHHNGATNVDDLTIDTSGNLTAGLAVVAGVTSTVTITTANLQFRGNDVLKDGLPTCSGAGCVMGATSTNTAMNMTTTTTGAADITVTFSGAFDNAPSCFANNDTTGNLLRVTTVAVGSIHVQGTTVSGDTLRVGCFGN